MSVEGLDAHLATGVTGIARCWKLTRRDGRTYGFTDHDRDLVFDGVTFRAGTGLSAASLSQSTGLAVDNTEAVGALSDAAVTEADIAAGRFDGAAIEAWSVQWADPANRVIQFRGTLGEVSRANGAFTVELRGLAEALNVARGRVHQKSCPAVLGDADCGFDLATPGYSVELPVASAEGARVFTFAQAGGFEARWFERGVVSVLDGAAAGLSGAIKRDRPETGGARRVELWDSLRAEVAPGDRLKLVAGCDKRMETCRLKFSNILNFRGFPDIPGEDWMLAHPTRLSVRTGGSRR
ncbi:DUF2163 domain-containing protein [Roseibacterium sp. SDUM158017]|uniref:DUF2163 domain-containing protein n=1 Tax=Roseicyclus salinarum TaxID=3036773 RepID=UPI0024156357|nr:DUF2163 domain-containing protein [Roseibacterium sp. SDUM158017]MDG4649809.1 DUF2163 domain-containing protein [Roseibacterium sp. SDUM158017]